MSQNKGRLKWIFGIGLLILMVVTTAAPAVDTGDAGDGPSVAGEPADGGGSTGGDSTGGGSTGDGSTGSGSTGDVASPEEGVDSDGDGFVDSAEQADTGPLAEADPQRYDVFIEVDYAGTSDPEKITEALDVVERRFANAPVSNPDGSTGIDLHLVLDEQVPAGRLNNRFGGTGRGGHSFDTEYRDYRDAGYHYATINVRSSVNRNGWTWIGAGRYGKMFVRTESDSPPPDAFMHELGHALGLNEADYRGIDSQAVPLSRYYSVMNYAHTGDDRVQFNDGGPFDDWAFIADGFTPMRGGGECPTRKTGCPTRSTPAGATYSG